MNFRRNWPKEKIKEFKIGEFVIYVPNHANGDILHPDCEEGIVSSMNDKFIFVKFYRSKNFNRTIETALKLGAQICDRTNLVSIKRYMVDTSGL